VFVLIVVLFGAQFLHLRMRPQEIEELMRSTQLAKAEATVQDSETRDKVLKRILRRLGLVA
jgi:hypothetical protein